MTHEQLLRIYWAANPEMVVSMQTYAGIQTGNIHNVNTTGFSTFYLRNDNGSVFQSADAIKPHLKPLSSISDEDAIAVAKMAIPGSGHFNIIQSDGGVLIRCHKDGHFLKFWIEYYNGFVLKIYGDRDYEPPVNNPNQNTDYLRSKGYNLDFEEANYIKI